MDNIGEEAILEIFDFNQKKIFCSFPSEALISGLIKRGGQVWIDSKIKILDENNFLELKDKNFIYFNQKDLPDNFDYIINSNFNKQVFNKNKKVYAKEKIIILIGIMNLFKWHLIFNKFSKKDIVTYSIAPSLKKTRLIIPDQFDISFERYWSLNSKNLFISLRLILEWFIIKNKFLRKLTSDKLVSIK